MPDIENVEKKYSFSSLDLTTDLMSRLHLSAQQHGQILFICNLPTAQSSKLMSKIAGNTA
jgi:hypothetical protein